MRKIVNRLLPVGTKRRQIAKRLAGKQAQVKNGQISYKEWINNVEPSLFLPASKSPKRGPLISIIVPCFNTPDKYLQPLLSSVISQTYNNWQLCLVDASTNEERSIAIKTASSIDGRIIYQKQENLGISANTNTGIEMAEGKYIGLLDHDDTLAEQALSEVVNVINENPKVDLIYSDEDKISEDGSIRSLPFFKPDWSPELLLGVNYITHFVVIKKSIVSKIGGLRSAYDGAQDYDLFLRLTEVTDNIIHISKILYHWRLADGSTSKDVGQKNYADSAGIKALADAVKRRNIKAKVVEIADKPTNYRLDYAPPINLPLVSIIIPFKDKVDLLKQCVESILKKSTYKNYELILISNNSQEQSTKDYINKLSKNKKCKTFEFNDRFNYAKLNNFGRSKAKGKYLILLNNDTEVLSDNWIEELLGVASQSKIGAVGPLLTYPGGSIQHAGVILGMGTMAGHVFRNRLPEEWTDFGLPSWPRNYLALTAACLMVEAKKYDQVGGLDEKFIMAGNDVAFCLKLYEAGYRNVYWPFAILIHHENSSVVSYQNAPASDYEHSLTYYRPYLNWHDPYFNRNLDLMNEQVALRRDYE